MAFNAERTWVTGEIVNVKGVQMNFFKYVWNRVASEPAVTIGVIVAAVNSAVDQSWQGYAVAVGVALLRFIFTPALPLFGARRGGARDVAAELKRHRVGP